MNKLNEELLKVRALENQEENEIQAPLVTAVDPAYTDAKTKYDQLKKRLDALFKDQEKATKEFIKDTERKEIKTDVKKDLKKLKLDESLFEDYNEDPNTYSEIFNILDNIEFITEGTRDLGNHDWTPAKAKEIYESLDEQVDELEKLVKELEARDDSDIEESFIDIDVPISANVTANGNTVPFLNGSTKTEELEEKDPHFFQLDEAVAAISDDIIYKNKRECLADIIQQDLTSGEWVYKVGKNGNLVATPAPSLNLDIEEVGVNVDEKGEFINAWMKIKFQKLLK